MAANVAWQSEIWPAMPVITVNDRKITASTSACVARSSQYLSFITKAMHAEADDDAEDAGRRA